MAKASWFFALAGEDTLSLFGPPLRRDRQPGEEFSAFPKKASPVKVAMILMHVLERMGLWAEIKLSQDQEEELRKDVDKQSKDLM